MTYQKFNKKLTVLLCEACNTLEELEQWYQMSDGLRDWWIEHQKEDSLRTNQKEIVTIKTITVNSNNFDTFLKTVSYNDILKFAQRDAGLSYSVTWSWKNSKGVLNAGNSVVVLDGMIFNCYYTGNA